MIPKELLKKVRRIEIHTNRLVNDILAGEYHSTFKGQGMEFDEVREYQAGDEIRSIDWNVTARTGKPFVKRFVEERELTVMLLVDASASGLFGTKGQLKKEYAAELASVLAFSAIKNNDKVGLIIFTGQVEKYVPPKKGRAHVLRVIHEILFFEPKGNTTRIESALEFLSSVQKRKTVSFLVSDFQDHAYDRALQIANRRHDVIAIRIEDPRESSLPDVGFLELQDAETGQMALVDTADPAVRREFQVRVLKDKAERERVFRKSDVDEIFVRTDKSYTDPLMKFFRARERLR